MSESGYPGQAAQSDPGEAGRSKAAAGQSPPAPSGPSEPPANARKERKRTISFWPAQLTVAAAIVLQVTLPNKLTVGPSWLLPALEGVLLVGLATTTPHRHATEHPNRRRAAIGMIALVNAANAVSLVLLAHFLLHGGKADGRSLILAGMTIWATNMLIFALWYWEMDRGGPGNRVRHPDPTTPEGSPDFLFTQMGDALPYTPEGWMPGFIDYLTLAFTTATAFSPTDVLPLSPLAKTLMAVQSLVSLVTLGLVISRAVNILS